MPGHLAPLGRWNHLLVIAAVVLIALPILAEKPSPRPARDAPYAVQADAMFSELARRAERPMLVDAWARERGLAPTSAAVRELVAKAVEIESRYPHRLTDQARAALLSRFAGDETGLAAARQRERADRYRAVGEALGAWLEARRAEGYPPAFLVERLLRVHAPITAYSRPGPKGEAGPGREVRAFEEGLRTSMPGAPKRLLPATATDR